MPAAPPIVVSAFQGEQPRIIPRLIPETAGQVAYDVRLDDGGLTPFRESVYRGAAATRTWKSFYKYLNEWIGWNNIVDAVPAPIAEDRIYYTGDGEPKMRVANKVYSLEVERPVAAPGVSGSGTGSGDVFTSAYVYTYVTEINGIQEESEPSPASILFDRYPTGRSYTVTNLKKPTNAARGIKYQRIYRLQTGAAGTYFYFVHQRDVSDIDWPDNVLVDAMAEPCPSINHNAPPKTLQGLTALPNGMMVAFEGKKLYFCEPYKPHAWPEIYSLTMDYEIVALGAMGMTTLVATTGQPYLVTGSRPDSMAAQKLEQNLPCIGRRTLVDLGYAVAYASNEGLVVAAADGSVRIASGNLFNRHDWAALDPVNMIGCQYNGRYCAFYTPVTGIPAALLIDLSGQGFLIRSTVKAQAAIYDVAESALFYIPTGTAEIRQMDAPGALSKFLHWKSKEFVLPYPENYGAFRVDGIVNDETINPDIVAKQIAAIIDSNTLAMTKRYTADDITDTPVGKHTLKSIGGDLNGIPADPGPSKPLPRDIKVQNEIVGGENSCPLNGDYLLPLPRGTGAGNTTSVTGKTSVTVGVYADKKLVAEVTEANTPVRLPSGFRAQTWEFDVKTNGRVYRLSMAKNMDDLKRQP